MFISKKFLSDELGVDPEIAAFFVDRKVPDENAFWNKRLLYVGRGNGFISIPVYYDLLFRIGVKKQLLLEEAHILFMEQLMHYAIQAEFQQITFSGQVENIKQLLSDRVKDKDFYRELLTYLDQPVLKPLGKLGMPVPALNRADVFLFILCDLPLSGEEIALAIKYWYALHTNYLLMDDIYDYKIDKQDHEENAVLELGEGEEGFEKAFGIMHANVGVLYEINPVLSGFFDRSFKELQNNLLSIL